MNKKVCKVTLAEQLLIANAFSQHEAQDLLMDYGVEEIINSNWHIIEKYNKDN